MDGVGPAADVILTVSEAQDELGDSTASTTQIQRWIDAVTELIENEAGPVLPREVTQSVTGYGTVLLEGRVIAVTSALAYGAEVADYTLRAEAGLLLPTYPHSLYGSVLTYTVGLDPIPASVKEAAIIAVKHFADVEAGAVPVPYGGTDQTFVFASGFVLPNRSKELLAPWRRGPGIA